MISRKTWLNAIVAIAGIATYSAQPIAGATTPVDGTVHGVRRLAPLQLPAPTVPPPPGCAPIGPVMVFCSAEVGDATEAGRLLVDSLDDLWRSAAFGSTFVVGRIKDADLPVVLGGMFNPIVTVSLRNVSTIDLASPTGRGTIHDKQGIAKFAGVNTMQEGAPKPACLATLGEAAWNEEVGLEDSRNAALFTFDPPVKAFGAWFGDLETRSDGWGTPAVLRLFDADMQPIGADVRVPSSTPNQGLCEQSQPGCGNRTTRWIGFVADATTSVSAMLVVVGDDDAHDKSGGTREHLGFIGPTVAYVSQPSATAVPIERSSLPVKLHFPLLPKGLRVDPRLAEDVCAG